MSDTGTSLRKALCSSFCAGITVNPVPFGLAISTVFEDGSGDRIGFYAVEDEDGLHLEDDGDYLPHLIASGIDIEKGQRRSLIESVLASAGAHYDADTYEIRTGTISQERLPEMALRFVSALMRIRDVERLNRDFVKSTFKEDALRALVEHFADIARVEERGRLGERYQDFQPDAVVHPHSSGRSTAVYFANGIVPLQEAELLHAEIMGQNDNSSFDVVALLEDFEKIDVLGRRRFQRAQNRGLVMPIFRGDERNAMAAVKRVVGARPVPSEWGIF
ncbi:DUF1828 domain-containing protein [Terrihabitans rhizophilus]|uniref:DUF1828 domain-containing protein n=1 Tax=Terrihabitans rhizophilus TaxID=3092662 RepID=A0ABU4RN88_9HYPH|nr:DUF1828 domain-containing protein [Terrihabitans sp. PJ23]MDX6806279.1 DUF1828 domain-containing protein [Terrihabitans sp. PJ23]